MCACRGLSSNSFSGTIEAVSNLTSLTELYVRACVCMGVSVRVLVAVVCRHVLCAHVERVAREGVPGPGLQQRQGRD